jgi:hypothetical protein
MEIAGCKQGLKTITQTRVIEEAIIYDLQKNIMIGGRFHAGYMERIMEDMINLAAQSALSIAFRYAVFKLINRAAIIVDDVLNICVANLLENQTKKYFLCFRFN